MDGPLSNADRYVLRNLIDRHAQSRGDSVFALFPNGDVWTYEILRRSVRKVAASLQALGVRQDDFVLSWLPNGPHALAVWFALNYIGAVYVPVNISYRGRLLAHVIANSGARLMIADARLAERLTEVETACQLKEGFGGQAPAHQLGQRAALVHGFAENRLAAEEIGYVPGRHDEPPSP